jgi:hypothetical protein
VDAATVTTYVESAEKVAVQVVAAVAVTVVVALVAEFGFCEAVQAQRVNLYPVFGVAVIDHESLPLSTLATVPLVLEDDATVTVLSEFAVKVAVHVMAAVAVTSVAALTTEVGVSEPVHDQLVKWYPVFAVAMIDHESLPLSTLETVPLVADDVATVTT